MRPWSSCLESIEADAARPHPVAVRLTEPSRLWDAATGQLRGAPMKHDRPVYGAVFDRGEGRILSYVVG
jgi:hypothetical protein